MSEQQIIGDLFAKQKAKKQKTQKGQPKVAGQGPSAQDSKKREKAEETKKEDSQPSTQLAQTQQQEFAESSEEETDIALDGAIIKDAKEVEASKRKEEAAQSDRFDGWGLDKQKQSAAKSVAVDSQVQSKANQPMDMDALKSRTTGPKTSKDIVFKSGPQTFNKSKNMINQQEFPELGELEGSKNASASSNASKKDSTSIGHFGSAITSGKPKDGQSMPLAAQKPVFEEKKEAKMPVFTKKIKVTTDASQNLENIPSKQNYDFSSMKISSAATSKTAAERAKEREENPDQKQEHSERAERAERTERTDKPRERAEHDFKERHERGERSDRGERGGRGRGGFGSGFEKSDRPAFKKDTDKKDSDDSFEEVKERKRGPATFSRGGKSYGDNK